MEQYTPAAAALSGDVLIVNDMAAIQGEDNPPNGQDGVRQGSVCIHGGLYWALCDSTAPAIGQPVFWSVSGSVVTLTASGNYPLGECVSGPNDGLVPLLSAAAPSIAGSCFFRFDPGFAAGAESGYYNLGAAASDTVTNTNAATAFATTAIIAAGDLEVGDEIHVRVTVAITGQNSTNTNLFLTKITTGPVNTLTAVVNSGALNMAANTAYVADLDIAITAIGASGAFNAFGVQGGNAALTPFTPVLNTAINTLLPITLEVTDQQSAISAGNVAQIVQFDVVKKRK